MARSSKSRASTQGSPATQLRLNCVRLLLKMQSGGGSLTRLLPEMQQQLPADERAQFQAWIYGFCRWSHELQGIVEQLVDKPLKLKDADINLLIQLGIFQLRHTRVAAHAAVDETVKVTRLLNKKWAGSLVNAVLRNYQRQQHSLQDALPDAAIYSHPVWLLRLLKADWPDEWIGICDQNNQQAPMTLRVNQLRGGTEAYAAQLQQLGMSTKSVAGLEHALVLEQATSVENLPGFAEGSVSVQDAAAQLTAAYLQKHAKNRGRMLDACAAPGGKTAHILETGHMASVLAIDKDADRLERVAETLQRLDITHAAQLQACDATDLDAWWDGQLFDAVLLDAPCSGTGVIRRHPDIKLLRRESDIDELVSLQAALLDKLWKTLQPDGVLLYATCSVLKRENEQQVEAFLARTADAKLLAQVRQILPGQDDMDGFFYAPLGKIGA